MRNLKKTLLLAGSLLTGSIAFSQDNIVKIKTDQEVGSSLSFCVNHCKEGLSIDWGDGNFVSYTPEDNDFLTTISGTVKGTEINIKGSNDWYMLDCSHCNITDINLSAAKQLRSLFCQHNNITTIDVKGLVNLVDLNCSNNKITHLIFTDSNNAEKDLKAIENLDISHNNFSGTYSYKLQTLQHLKANNNKFDKFYINDENLLSLDCSHNKISGFLSVAKSGKLSNIVCHNNNISSLYLANKGAAIKQIICDNNKVKRLSLNDAAGLRNLLCSNNGMQNLSISNKAAISGMDVAGNALTFSILPAKDKAPRHITFEPQQPVDISQVEGMLVKDNVPYAPIASNWDERNATNINLSAYYTLSDNTVDATCKWYSVDTNGHQSEMTECTTAADGDFCLENGKTAFFKAQKKAYAQLTSNAYGFVLTTTPIAVGSDITAIENVKNDTQQLHISIAHNAILLNSNSAIKVDIYTIEGKNVWSAVVNGATTVTLPKGVYIVNNKKIVL